MGFVVLGAPELFVLRWLFNGVLLGWLHDLLNTSSAVRSGLVELARCQRISTMDEVGPLTYFSLLDIPLGNPHTSGFNLYDCDCPFVSSGIGTTHERGSSFLHGAQH